MRNFLLLLEFAIILGIVGCDEQGNPVMPIVPTTGSAPLSAYTSACNSGVDSDGGGLPDFIEDFNGDGTVEAGDTNPRDPADDHRHFSGTIDDVRRYETDYSDPNSSNTMEVSQERYHVVVDLEATPVAQGGDPLQGTAKVTYTNGAHRVYRHPYTCGAGQATQLNIDHADREWTASLVGRFTCSIQGGTRVIGITASGQPDHSDAPDTITYRDTCHSDTQRGTMTATWGSFTEYGINAAGMLLHVNYPLPGGVTSGENAHIVDFNWWQ
jgi:hypothetical protein